MSEPMALIIEDDEDLSLIFAEALRMAGFQSEVITDGAQAQQRLIETVPDVVVLDLHLPHISGQSLLAQIRADVRLAATRIIVASADPVMADTLRQDADLVLIKPVSFGQLRDFAMRLKPA